MYSKLFIVVLFCLLFFINLNAQNRTINKAFDNIDTFESLSITYGWHYNPNNDKWITKQNEIKGIDKFIHYSILSFHDNSNKYIVIIKEYDQKGKLNIDTYILDFEDYVDQISRWDEDAILTFPILKYHHAVVKKDEVIINSMVGLDNLNDISKHPDNYFVFQYKFFPDQTVKFLFYVKSHSSEGLIITGMNTETQYTNSYKHIGKDDLYKNFFYKTTPEYFTKFCDSPLNKE